MIPLPSRRGIESDRLSRHLCLAPGVEGVVDGKLQVELPVVVRADGGESMGDGLKPCGLGDNPDICGDIGPVDDAGQDLQARLLKSVVLDQDLEAALPLARSEEHTSELQ